MIAKMKKMGFKFFAVVSAFVFISMQNEMSWLWYYQPKMPETRSKFSLKDL